VERPITKLDLIRAELKGRQDKNMIVVPIPGGKICFWHIRKGDDRLPKGFQGIKVEVFFKGKESRFFLPWDDIKGDDSDYQDEYLSKLAGHMAGAISVVFGDR
jgi:hypothetical protein